MHLITFVEYSNSLFAVLEIIHFRQSYPSAPFLLHHPFLHPFHHPYPLPFVIDIASITTIIAEASIATLMYIAHRHLTCLNGTVVRAYHSMTACSNFHSSRIMVFDAR